MPIKLKEWALKHLERKFARKYLLDISDAHDVITEAYNLYNAVERGENLWYRDKKEVLIDYLIPTYWAWAFEGGEYWV